MRKLATKLIVAAVVLSVTTIRGGQAEEALQKMRNAWKPVNQYTVRLVSYLEKDGKTSNSTIEFSYKRPGWVKIEVIEGDKKGSAAVYDPNKDRIQVRWAGIALPVHLSPDTKMAKSLRGEKIYSITFEKMLEHTGWYLANGSLSWVGEETVDGVACAVIEFKTSRPEKNLGIARERWWLDKSTGFIRKINGFDANGKKVQWSIFRDLKLNPDLPEDHFKL
ncbi:outer membrane lipoprotein carrier protein LolA [candidate division WOR-3 bacterium]|nr:outer membrane lipoprotein carrier protein LolA [candidate division WOR-3 bacterium]